MTFDTFFPPTILTYVSDKSSSFSFQQDQKHLTDKQIRHLSDSCRVRGEKTVSVQQVHGNNIHLVTAQDAGKILPRADGLVTREKDLPIVVRTADCLSIFLYDPIVELIGVLHAGWQSTYKKISSEAINLLKEQFGTKPKDLFVAFGPCIRSCCYDITEERSRYFPDDIINRDEKVFLDLPRTNKNQLIQLGVREDHVRDCKICTCCHKEYFSFRREGAGTGRMISLIMQEKETK